MASVPHKALVPVHERENGDGARIRNTGKTGRSNERREARASRGRDHGGNDMLRE